LALVGILAFLLLSSLLRDDAEPPAEGCPPSVAARCPPTSEEAALALLAEAYAPVIYLRAQAHECDRAGAGYEPLPVEIVLDNPAVALRRVSDGTVIKWGPSAADLYQNRQGTFLDFPGNPRRPGCRYEQDGRRFGAGEPNVAYVHLAREEGHDKLALQYWFFYYFNDWNNKHEGDWEMVQVIFEATSARDALTRRPVSVAYAQHGGGETAPWPSHKLQREGERPVVYVAVGSQASFYNSHIYLGRAEQGSGFGCDDASPPSRRITIEPRLMPSGSVGPESPFAWLAFEGRWGELAGPDFDGPTGPNMKEQWLRPISWQDQLRSSSVRVPSRAAIGPDAVAVFCDVIGVGSHYLLPVIIQVPLVVAAAAGVFSLGALASLTRTRYFPVQARPLRVRRKIGQILLSAAEIYRGNLGLFLRLGLAFIPAGIIVAAVQRVLVQFTPLGDLGSLATQNVGQRAVLALALAQAEFGITYAIVVAASTAALARLERGEPTAVRDAFIDALKRIHDLVLPRLFTIVVVTALAFTIIGIPLALRQAVRWVFIEQAVLLDNRGGIGALRESAATVSTDLLWAACAVIALGLLGLAAAPAFGIVLMLAFRSFPVSYIGFATSFVYVAFVPYVAVCLALVYFDLKSRQGNGPGSVV
jgi:hypothetical protein